MNKVITPESPEVCKKVNQLVIRAKISLRRRFKKTKCSLDRIIKKDNVIKIIDLVKEPKIILKRLPKEIVQNKQKLQHNKNINRIQI